MKFLIYLVRRLLWTVPVLLVVTLLVFVLSRVLPGNPVYLMVPVQEQTAEVIARVEREMGLDQPIWIQYQRYMSDLLRGDLGTAWLTGNAVLDDLVARFPATLDVGLTALIIAVTVGVPLGVLSAVHKDTFLDHLVRAGSLTGLSMPNFWLGIMAIYFLSFQVNVFPRPTGRLPIGVAAPGRVTGSYVIDSVLVGDGTALVASLRQIALPAITLALGSIAGISRMVRSQMNEVLNSGYVRALKAYGVAENRIHYLYALKNALGPTITFVGNSALYLLGGTVIIETVFAWPGVGKYATDALFQKDYVAVQGVALTASVLAVLIYIAVDVSYFLVDPRVQYGDR